MSQTIDLEPLAADIVAGADFELSGWLGGNAEQGDHAFVTASFLDAGGKLLATHRIGPVLPADRDGATGLRFRRADRPSTTSRHARSLTRPSCA